MPALITTIIIIFYILSCKKITVLKTMKQNKLSNITAKMYNKRVA